MIEIFLPKTKQVVRLDDKDFKAQGGEGKIYIKGSTAYKVVTAAGHMIPPAKIQELSSITEQYIIKPEDIFYENNKKSNQQPIGYTMKSIDNGIALCRIFPPKFRTKVGITPDRMLKLVQRLQNGIKHVHSKDILIVDLNEMNFMVDETTYENIYFIDVNSYATKNFPAQSLMESVRDWHTKGFSQLTDWFSFAVVSFNMFVGIHPYKGSHPQYGNDWVKRMQNNISVFNSQVSVPSVALPLDVIPQAYREWYKAVLEEGKRLPPPSDLNAVIIIASNPRIRVENSNIFIIQELMEFDEDIEQYWCNKIGVDITVTSKHVYKGKRKIANKLPDAYIGETPTQHQIIMAYLDRGEVKLYNADMNCYIDNYLKAENLMSYDGRLYGKLDGGVYEIEFTELPNKVIARSKYVASVMNQATSLFEGVAIQNMLGTYFANIFSHAGTSHQRKLSELSGYQIIEAKYDNQVLMVVGAKSGKYDLFVYKFDKSFSQYDVRIETDISYQGINFTVLENGVAVNLNHKDELELFRNRHDVPGVKEVVDPAIKGDMRLSHKGTQTLFFKGSKIYSMTMKP